MSHDQTTLDRTTISRRRALQLAAEAHDLALDLAHQLAGVGALALEVAELRVDVGDLAAEPLLLLEQLLALAADLLEPLPGALQLRVVLGGQRRDDDQERQGEERGAKGVRDPRPRAPSASRTESKRGSSCWSGVTAKRSVLAPTICGTSSSPGRVRTTREN